MADVIRSEGLRVDLKDVCEVKGWVGYNGVTPSGQ